MTTPSREQLRARLRGKIRNARGGGGGGGGGEGGGGVSSELANRFRNDPQGALLSMGIDNKEMLERLPNVVKKATGNSGKKKDIQKEVSGLVEAVLGGGDGGDGSERKAKMKKRKGKRGGGKKEGAPRIVEEEEVDEDDEEEEAPFLIETDVEEREDVMRDMQTIRLDAKNEEEDSDDDDEEEAPDIVIS